MTFGIAFLCVCHFYDRKDLSTRPKLKPLLRCPPAPLGATADERVAPQIVGGDKDAPSMSREVNTTVELTSASN